MAKLSAHGKELGRVYYTTYAKAYMEDGTILITDAGRWKVCSRPKAGVTIHDVLERARQKQHELYERNPAIKVYREHLRAVAGMGKAWKLHASIELLGDDIDGIWSECCDGYGDNVHADVDEIRDLVKDYNVALEASRASRASRSTKQEA